MNLFKSKSRARSPISIIMKLYQTVGAVYSRKIQAQEVVNSLGEGLLRRYHMHLPMCTEEGVCAMQGARLGLKDTQGMRPPVV